MLRYIDDAVSYAEVRGISAVLAMADVADLCHAAMGERLPSLVKGPSIKAVHCCFDKLCARESLAKDDLDFCHIDIYNPPDASALDVPLPAFIKPVSGVFSQMCSRVDCHDDLLQACEVMRRDIHNMTHYLPPFYELHAHKLQNAKSLPPIDPSRSAILEHFVQDEWKKVFVDGYIVGGKAEVIGIVDNNYHISNPRMFYNLTFPSNLYESRPHVADLIEERFKQVCKHLADLGFGRQLLNVEFFVGPAGEVIFMEANGRGGVSAAPLYRMTLEGGVDHYTLAVELGLGRHPTPPQRNNLVGTAFYVNIIVREGQTADDLIDWDVAAALPSFDFKVPRGKVLPASGADANGTRIGMFYVTSESYEENIRLGATTRRLIVKRHDQTFWD